MRRELVQARLELAKNKEGIGLLASPNSHLRHARHGSIFVGRAPSSPVKDQGTEARKDEETPLYFSPLNASGMR